MYSALRLEELAAITQDDLDGCWLNVSRQVDELTRRLTSVKSESGRVPLPPWLIFRVETLTEVRSPKAIRKATANAGRRVGIQLNPHHLRTR